MAEPVAIGIDVGGTKLVAATLDADGRVLRRLRRETPARDQERLVAEVGALADELAPGLPVGVGIAGMVTPEGVVRYGPNISVRDLDLAGAMRAQRPRTVAVVNDASAAALGEQRAGAARGHAEVVLLTLGTGVGGGLVSRGELLLGTQGFAGELGHMLVQVDGRLCPCGTRGCIEAYASGSAIGRRAQELLADDARNSPLRDLDEISGKAVTEAARAGDGLAEEVLVDAGRWLGMLLVSLVNALDPEIVLLGGGAAAETADWVLPAARETMETRILGADRRTPPPVELAGLGDDAGMIGAGLLAAERVPAH